MAEPRIIGENPDGTLIVELPTGGTANIAPVGLPAPMIEQYQAGQNMSVPSDLAPFQAVAPGQIAAQAARDLAPFQATGAPPMSRPQGPSGPMESFSPNMIGARTQRQITDDLARGQQAAKRASSPTAAASPASQVEGDDEFGDLSPTGTTATQAGQPQGGGGLIQGYTREQLEQLYRQNPNAVIGGSAGQRVVAQGPSQRTQREATPGMAAAMTRERAARADRAEQVGREMGDVAMAQDVAQLEQLTAADQAQQVADRIARRNAEKAAAVREGTAKYRAMVADQQAAEDRGIDPDHYWASKSTGSRIAAGIGILLSGMGQGLMGGGTNMAMDVINDAIARDMAAQRENIAGKGRRAEAQRGLLAQTAAMYDDETAQDLAAQAAAWRVTERKLAAAGAQAAAGTTRAQIAELRGNVALEAAQREQELEQHLAATVQTSRVPVTVGGSAGVKVKDLLEANKTGPSRYGAGRHVPGDLFVPAYQMNAVTDEEAKTMRELAASSTTLVNLYRQLIKFRSEAGNLTDPEKRARARAIAADAALIKKGPTQAALGVLAGPDMDIINAAQGGDPAEILSFNSARYDQAIKNTRGAERDRVMNTLVPVDPESIPENLRRRAPWELDAARGSMGGVE